MWVNQFISFSKMINLQYHCAKEVNLWLIFLEERKVSLEVCRYAVALSLCPFIWSTIHYYLGVSFPNSISDFGRNHGLTPRSTGKPKIQSSGHSHLLHPNF